MKFLDDLIRKPNVFQRTVGLSLEQFEILERKIGILWDSAELKRKTHNSRKRSMGGGRSYKLISMEHKLLAILLYYKAYFTQEFIGILVGLDQANISRLFSKIRDLIEEAADPELKTYLANANAEYTKFPPQQRINSLADFFIKYPDFKEISTDATEQHCHRSQDNEIQKKYYSGKKKMHSLKTQISVSSGGKILDVSDTYPGSIHDKNIIDQEQTVQKIPETTCQRFDSGYQGIAQKSPRHYIVLPLKKPRKRELSPLAKDLNRVNSKRRVIVENVLSRLKKFKICKYTFRGPIATYNQIFRNIAALLNFRLNNKVAAI